MSFRRLFFAGLLIFSGSSLVALPDPDLFDGRVSKLSPELPASNGGEIIGELAEEVGGQSRPQSESRDYSQFDGAGFGQPVSVEDSRNIEGIKQTTSTNTLTGSVAKEIEIGRQESSGSPSSVGIQRSFEEFEVGLYSGAEGAAVEVNRSIELTEVPSAQPDFTASSEPKTQTSNTDEIVVQEQTKKSGSADFGSDLPSGL